MDSHNDTGVSLLVQVILTNMNLPGGSHIIRLFSDFKKHSNAQCLMMM